MAASLTTLISQVQALLLDSGTLFTTATCTAAVRDALSRLNVSMPIHAATLVDAVADQLSYALSDTDFEDLIDIVGVWKQGTNEADEALDFDPYFEDNAPFVRLRSALAEGDILIVRYTLPHTVNGLDGEVESTLTGHQDAVLVDGSCAAAIQIRLSSRVETINLAPEVTENYKAAMAAFQDAFRSGLAFYARRRAGMGQPDTRAWEDEWHSWM